MATKKEETIQIQKLDIRTIPIRIVGDSPLIIHAWAEKAKREILDKQMKVTKTKAKEPRNPISDFMNSLYWLTEMPKEATEKSFEAAIKNGAKFGFPVGAIKQAANSAAYRLGWVKDRMGLRGAYFIKTEFGEMAEIKGSAPVMREDMVKIGKGTADIRYRGQFDTWFMEMILEYNASGDMTAEQIINCIDAGGYVCGLGEWRPEKDGTYGKFHVEAIN